MNCEWGKIKVEGRDQKRKEDPFLIEVIVGDKIEAKGRDIKRERERESSTDNTH